MSGFRGEQTCAWCGGAAVIDSLGEIDNGGGGTGTLVTLGRDYKLFICAACLAAAIDERRIRLTRKRSCSYWEAIQMQDSDYKPIAQEPT